MRLKKQQQQSEFNTREWLLVRLRKSEKGAKKNERNETGISLKTNCLIFVKRTFMTFAKQRPKEKKTKKKNHTILRPSPEIKNPS
jgi:hypothetical protein